MTVVVPDGLGAGDAFTVAVEGGGEYTVHVPDGLVGGDSLSVEVPRVRSRGRDDCPPSPDRRARTGLWPGETWGFGHV